MAALGMATIIFREFHLLIRSYIASENVEQRETEYIAIVYRCIVRLILILDLFTPIWKKTKW